MWVADTKIYHGDCLQKSFRMDALTRMYATITRDGNIELPGTVSEEDRLEAIGHIERLSMILVGEVPDVWEYT